MGTFTCRDYKIFDEEGREIQPTPRAKEKSPTGFAWGYGGSGPAATAHTLLHAVTNNYHITDDLYQKFKLQVVSQAPDPQAPWQITSDEIEAWLNKNGCVKVFTVIENHRDNYAHIDLMTIDEAEADEHADNLKTDAAENEGFETWEEYVAAAPYDDPPYRVTVEARWIRLPQELLDSLEH